MNPVYLIKKTNICISTCCTCHQPQCPTIVGATLSEIKSIEMRDFYKAKCEKECNEEDNCFTYTIDKVFLTGQYEDLC